MTDDKARLLNVMSHHLGRQGGINAHLLADEVGLTPRRLRKLISRCRAEDGVAICGHPTTGYYIAVTPEELQQSCDFLENRAMHSLMVLSRMRKVSMPDLLGQLRLNQA